MVLRVVSQLSPGARQAAAARWLHCCGSLLKSPEELIRTVKSESLPLILAVLVLAVCYILMLRLTDRNKPEKAAADTSAEKEQ